MPRESRKRSRPDPLARPTDEEVYSADTERFRRLLESKRSSFAPTQANVHVLSGHEFSLSWVRRFGISKPIKILDRSGLGMRLPAPSFTVRDVADLLGHDFSVDIIDVAAQHEIHGWTLGDWAEYFHRKSVRRAVLNVISLEFSGTNLEPLVRAPAVVRQIDWIDNVWPGRRHARGQYPRVQLYCLMSVAGSWTDFHIDFGGTSVWYHVHMGRKTFLFAPPTDVNLQAYERWTTSPTQSTTFLGDLLETCFEVTLDAGHTLVIPTGWIHAVHTPVDSLVFGGNFLHGFDCPGQLRIYELEMFTRVPRKYRFPYFEHIHYYVIGYYLQFARLPAFRRLLRSAAQLSDAAGSASASVHEPGASHIAPPPEMAVLTAELADAGLSWFELAGLPALLRTMARMRDYAIETGRVARPPAVPPASSAAPPTSAAATAPDDPAAQPSGATSTLGSPSSPPTQLPPRPRLKLVVKAGMAGTAGPQSVVAEPVPSRPDKRQTMRVKGARGGAKKGVDSAEAAAAPADADDEFDVFTSTAAAAEAATMAVAPGGLEAMLAELAARIDPTATDAALAAWPTPDPPSVLRMHAEPGGGASAPPVRSALDANPGGYNLPKADATHLPAYNRPGGFGLYDGRLPDGSTLEDEVSATGAGYSYDEPADSSGGGSRVALKHQGIADVRGGAAAGGADVGEADGDDGDAYSSSDSEGSEGGGGASGSDDESYGPPDAEAAAAGAGEGSAQPASAAAAAGRKRRRARRRGDSSSDGDFDAAAAAEELRELLDDGAAAEDDVPAGEDGVIDVALGEGEEEGPGGPQRRRRARASRDADAAFEEEAAGTAPRQQQQPAAPRRRAPAAAAAPRSRAAAGDEGPRVFSTNSNVRKLPAAPAAPPAAAAASVLSTSSGVRRLAAVPTPAAPQPFAPAPPPPRSAAPSFEVLYTGGAWPTEPAPPAGGSADAPAAAAAAPAAQAPPRALKLRLYPGPAAPAPPAARPASAAAPNAATDGPSASAPAVAAAAAAAAGAPPRLGLGLGLGLGLLSGPPAPDTAMPLGGGSRPAAVSAAGPALPVHRPAAPPAAADRHGAGAAAAGAHLSAAARLQQRLKAAKRLSGKSGGGAW